MGVVPGCYVILRPIGPLLAVGEGIPEFDCVLTSTAHDGSAHRWRHAAAGDRSRQHAEGEEIASADRWVPHVYPYPFPVWRTVPYRTAFSISLSRPKRVPDDLVLWRVARSANVGTPRRG